MEKNSDTKDSNSEGSLDDNTETPDLESLIELEKSLILKQENLVKHVEDLKKMMDRNRKTVAYFEDLVSSKKIIEHESTNLEYLECLVSPIGSPHNSENSPEDPIENLPDSIVLTSRLMLPDSTSHNKETSDPSVILPPETNQDSTKESKNTLEILNLGILREMVELQIVKLQSNISDKNETAVDTESDSSFEIILHGDSMESNADSSGNSVGKGKEAANPKFRYKKRSKADASSNEPIDQEISSEHSKEVFDSPEIKTPKPKSPKNEFIKISPILCSLLMQPREHKGKCDTSSCESLDKDTPVKHSKKEFGTPDSKTLKPQSPNEEFTRVSPSVKRKQSDSNEQDEDKIQSNESCAETSPLTNLSGNHEYDDNLKTVKKLKFEDEEKPSKQYPSSTSLLLQKKQEKFSMCLAELIKASQTDQSGNSSERLILPSTSGLSNTVSYIFTSEESSPTDESDYISSNETGLSSLFYVSEDVSSSESRESFSKDVKSSVIGKSSFANVSEDVPSSEIGESSLPSVIEDVPSSVIEYVPSREIGEPSHTSVNEDVTLSEIEESHHITVDKDISLSKEPTFEVKREDK